MNKNECSIYFFLSVVDILLPIIAPNLCYYLLVIFIKTFFEYNLEMKHRYMSPHADIC